MALKPFSETCPYVFVQRFENSRNTGRHYFSEHGPAHGTGLPNTGRLTAGVRVQPSLLTSQSHRRISPAHSSKRMLDLYQLTRRAKSKVHCLYNMRQNYSKVCGMTRRWISSSTLCILPRSSSCVHSPPKANKRTITCGSGQKRTCFSGAIMQENRHNCCKTRSYRTDENKPRLHDG